MIRSTLSLIWKEYREQRWFLFAALAIFLGFPLIEATARYNNAPGMPTSLQPEFHSDSAVGLVLGFGGLLAIFVAVGSTTRDLRDELHVFWRSRPIGVGAWLGVKYAVGLLTVLTSCTLPVLMQFLMMLRSRQGSASSAIEVGTTLGIHSFTVVLLFSIAFLLGCLVRHATHAALLALAATLVVYFLPVVLGPISFLSVFNLMHREAFQLTPNFARGAQVWWWFQVPVPGFWCVVVQREWATFAAAMLGGSVAAALLAWLAVRRDWRVEVDRKAMHWSLGGVAVLLFGVTAFQVGSNLKVQRQLEFPVKQHTASGMATDGRRGVMLLRDTSRVQWYGQVNVKLCSFELTHGNGGDVSGARFGPVLAPADKINVPLSFNGSVLFWRPQRPDRAHLLVENSGHVNPQGLGGSNFKVESLELVTFDLTAAPPDAVVHRLDLRPLLPDMQTAARAHQADDRLLIAGRDNLLVVDLSNADAPRVERSIDMLVAGPGNVTKLNRLWIGHTESTDARGRTILTIPLPPLPDLNPRQRLAAQIPLALTNTRYAFDADTLAAADPAGISAYRLITIDEQTAQFERLGRRDHTPLERLTGSYTYSLMLRDGMLYAHQMRLGSGVSVYDLRDPARPRSAGYFGVPDSTDFKIAPLPDGRLLMAAERLYVLEPPESVK